jgi:hypothetical protein
MARGEPAKFSELARPPLTPGARYFCQQPLLQAQVRFQPDPDPSVIEVIYEDVAQQRILGSLAVPEESSQYTGKFTPPTRTDYPALVKAYHLTDTGEAPEELLARELAKDDGTFGMLIEAARLPAGHFGSTWGGDPSKLALPHYSVWTQVSKVSAMRARVALARHRSRQAFDELTVIFRLTETLDADPVVLAWMIRSTLRMFALHVIWEGLESHSWNHAELLALEEELKPWKPIEEHIRCWQGDRILALSQPEQKWSDAQWDNLELIFGPLPRWTSRIPGLDEFNHATLFRAQTKYCYLPLIAHDWRNYQEGLDQVRSVREYDLHSIWLKRMLPLDLTLSGRALVLELYIQMARTSLSLEDCFLAKGNYPATLSAMVPEYLPAVPSDLIDGNPLRYALTPNGRFRLYSIGPNFVDNGGHRPKSLNYLAGDLVWDYETTD